MSRPVTKKTISARINIALIDRLNTYVSSQNSSGISTKKVDVIEKALLEFLDNKEKEGLVNELKK
jgi:hypothetical protein